MDEPAGPSAGSGGDDGLAQEAMVVDEGGSGSDTGSPGSGTPLRSTRRPPEMSP